jgi:hypothetical protein
MQEFDKARAIEMMTKGKKMTHPLLRDRWVTMRAGQVFNQNGHDLPSFWMYRQDPQFQEGWTEYEPANKKTTQPNTDMKNGIEMIKAERERQIEVCGYSLQHDQNYTGEELIQFATFLLTLNLQYFPKNWDAKHAAKALQRSEVDNQVIAGAIIAANLDRINGKSKTFE